MFFLHSTGQGEVCQAILCGTGAGGVSGSPYLHELHRIKRKAPLDEVSSWLQVDLRGEKPLPPKTSVSAQDRPYAMLVNTRVLLADGFRIPEILKSADNLVLVIEGDPVIRDDGRKQERVCPATFRAFDPADTKKSDPIGLEYSSIIIPMDAHTSRGPTGTFELMHLQAVNYRIVIILGKVVAILNNNGYHSLV